uniref:Golgi apparatus membrane protein TVP23 homolog n=1 Tax=Caligus rogercresseyi TaxID=217165 RepID=C1BMD7_CALRO|nr:FAM18B [Caligus rogercresseyi]ACO11242.1 FAM18B [Caligus rogercresseyi]|eukprot:TRINITY_DN1696_c0_g1_i4.p1 TRINITY_DN1696_c0_g1~~TRINITY_DN1696_c0_g1_i4.p1  ORF type:complete len:219 (+),score=79.99 TRINITY_DN1696_c0_g1_i4:76-732(+)
MNNFEPPSDFGGGSSSSSGGTRVILNPTTTFFHLFFRFFSIFLYIFANYIFSFTSAFVFLLLLMSMDFWVVKNVTGRIMAGLRWWNYVDEGGESRWIFESRPKDSPHVHSSTEIRIFWGTLLLAPLLWVLFMFTSFWRLNVQWIVLPFIGILFTGTNLLGYLKCRFQNSDGPLGNNNSGGDSSAASFLQKKLISNIVSGLLSSKSQPQQSGRGSFQTI